jgi:hypothetical protein
MDLDRLHGRTILSTVGLNPYRKHRARPSDVVFAVAGVVVALALVAWALFG